MFHEVFLLETATALLILAYLNKSDVNKPTISHCWHFYRESRVYLQ